MAAPFFLFDIGTASPVAFGAGLAYIFLWLAVLIFRDWGKSKLPAKISLLQTLYGVSVPFAVDGLLGLLIVEWTMWAYRPITTQVWDGLVMGSIVITVILIYPPILFLLLAPHLLARKNGGPASRYLKGVRARGFAWFRISWLSNTASGAGAICLLSLLFAPELLSHIELLRDGDGAVTTWELVAAYPYLPFSLLATAAITALSTILIAGWETADDGARAYIDGTAREPGPDANTRTALGVLVAGACVVAMLVIAYPLHQFVTTTGVRDGMVALSGTTEALNILLNTHEDDDWTTAEYAEALNRLGYWTPEAPEAGLGSLIANAGETFPDSCTVRIAAGIIDAPAGDPDSQSTANEAEPEMKYCVAVACAPSFTWSAPPALLLYTSHESRAEGWRENWYPDVSAEGVAAAPGGYCTASGELANSFQG